MKKIFALILALAMVLSLCACGKEETAEPETLGQTLYKDFTAKVDAGEKDTQALADAILSSGVLPFDGVSMEVEPGWLMGFTADIEGFEKAVMFGPAIGAIPFVGYVFQLDSADNCEAFCAKLLENTAYFLLRTIHQGSIRRSDETYCLQHQHQQYAWLRLQQQSPYPAAFPHRPGQPPQD